MCLRVRMQRAPNDSGRAKETREQLVEFNSNLPYLDRREYDNYPNQSSSSASRHSTGSSSANMSVSTQAYPRPLFGYSGSNMPFGEEPRGMIPGHFYRDSIYGQGDSSTFGSYVDPETQMYQPRIEPPYNHRAAGYIQPPYPQMFPQAPEYGSHSSAHALYQAQSYASAPPDVSLYDVSRMDRSYAMGLPGPSISHPQHGHSYYPNVSNYSTMPFTGWSNQSSLFPDGNIQSIYGRDTDDGSRSKSSSRYRGVYWNKNCKAWRARIWVNGKSEHLGNYDVEIEAARAFDRRARELGRSGLNFPEADLEELSRASTKRRKERNGRETNKFAKLTSSNTIADAKAKAGSSESTNELETMGRASGVRETRTEFTTRRESGSDTSEPGTNQPPAEVQKLS